MKYASNVQWNNLNSTRNYPLVDNATRLDDYGNVLPNDIITDIHIQASTGLGKELYIGSVGISTGLISVTVVAEGEDVGDVVLVASITLPTPVNLNTNYQFKAHSTDAEGWITFGSGANSGIAAHYSFSTPAQSKIIPGLAVNYPAPTGVRGIRKFGKSGSLSGIVKLTSADSTELVIEAIDKDATNARVINGNKVDALVFKLNSKSGGATLLKKFLGPCDHSPESDTCNKPPIYGINGAIPDCNGAITLEIVEEPTVLGPIFTVTKNGTIPSWIQFDSLIEQSMVCSLTGLKSDVFCLDDCVTDETTGPFASYNPRFGGSL